ncbi:MAG: hypothetical protein KC583_16630 [Myxococcales bacterium]|nr:hypothetical protein [Myxococcales bacterium]
MPVYKYKCPECGQQRRIRTPLTAASRPVICGQPISAERAPDRVVLDNTGAPLFVEKGAYLDPRSDEAPVSQGCGTEMVRGVERVRFYLRADHTPAGGGGQRGWMNPGMSDIDYTSRRAPEEPRGHHLTYGYDGRG